jgi:transposase-like protein
VRKKIAIDEVKTKINGKWAFLWTAIDVKTSEIITLDVSWLRNGDELIRVKQKVVLWCCL